MEIETLQRLAARLLSTHPVGHRLCLIGGFRYRLLDASSRASLDIDYHWEGDLAAKQAEIIEVLRKRLLPEVERRFGYPGDVRPAAGPDADSPAVRIVEMVFYRAAEAGSRIEIPIEITRIPRLDPPVVRTVAGTVFLTVSDADMIESKIIALVARHFARVRDIVDIFLFQDTLPADAPARLAKKLPAGGLTRKDVTTRLERLRTNRAVHVREIERILQEQVAPAVAGNLRAAGGAAMMFDAVLRIAEEVLKEPQP